MSEHDLGAYAPPTADELAFDPRQPVCGAKPFPVTLILTALVFVGLVAAIFLFYRTGMHEGAQAPMAVGSPVGEIKSPAPADAQPQDPAAGLQIYQSEAGQPKAAGAPKFVPPPEQPAARASAPVQAAPAQPAPPPAAVAPPPVAAVSPPPAPALRPPLSPTPEAVVQPAAKAAATPPAAKAVAPKPAAPKPLAVKHAPAPATAATPGVAAVQIGAVSSTAIAEKVWNEAVAVAPGLGAGKGKGLEKIEKDGHVLYRTAVTGFASKAEAAAFCAKLKAAGKACFVK
jgi:hypothetical protein